MKNFIRILLFIPASILAFAAVLFIGVFILDIVGKFMNFSSSVAELVGGKSEPSPGVGIMHLIKTGIAGFFASMAYFRTGLWVLPDFEKRRNKLICLYILLIIVIVTLILFAFSAFSVSDIIIGIGYLVLLVELLLAFFDVKDDLY